MSDKVDPISMAVVRASLVAVAREIFTVFERTTLLPILYEVHDFGVSLFDDRLNLIADAPGVPEFVGSLDFALRAILDQYGAREPLEQGDVIITTHPFLTGNHPADASVIAPVFLGGVVVGYCGLKAHMGDLGAKDTYPCDSMSMYEEGLLIPPTKLYSGGAPNRVLASLIETNSRMPRETLGDMLAGAAALRVGAEKFADLVARFGHDVYRTSVDQLLEQGEREVRSVIETFMDGVYIAEDWLDDNGIDPGAVPLRCTVTISGSQMIVDTTGSAEQQRGAFNSTLPMTIAACRLALKRLTTEDRIPSNSGEHRALTVIAPEGSIFNATPPAATFQMALTAQRLGELVIAAVGPAAGGRIPAPSAGDATFMSGVITSDSGGIAFLDGMAPMGYGATATADGMSSLFHFPLAGLKLASAEVTEVRAPLVLRKSELCRDSGGPGRRRGGLGTRLEWVTRGEGAATLFAEKLTSPVVDGQEGGEAAPQRNLVVINPGSPGEIRAGKRADVRLAAGDTIVIQGGSGSGYGNPWEREPELVAEDVRQGYVSLEAARKSYRVVLDPGSLELDAEETARLRMSRSVG
jgi:N-methylhydantoinase B